MSIAQEQPAKRGHDRSTTDVEAAVARPVDRDHRHRPHLPTARVRLDDRTAAGIALGIAGLFMFNIICGPYAIGLGISAYRRNPRGADRTAAIVSTLLGIADLVILIVLIATKIRDGSWVWHLNR